MANVVVAALATWNGKALKKAKQDVNVFDKQLKNLARTFGVTFSAAALVSFTKKAVKAFADDEAAAKSLQLQLQNTGNAFRITEVENYIAALRETYSILTDLRKPFQTLLNVTGSVDLAQRSLEAALNISAGTSESLETVINAISAGLRGQNKGIIALNTGIDKNIIASGDMNKIMAALEQKFTGQSAARLETYAGKMDTLRKGTQDATKIIGEGLVDALTVLSKDDSVANLSDDMENFANNVAFATTNLAKLVNQLGSVTSSASFKPALLLLGAAASVVTANPAPFIAAFGAVGAMGLAGLATKDFGAKELPANQKRSASRLELKAIKDGVFFRKQENDQLKKKTEVDKLKDKFDLERIGLTVALNAATDEETKLRIRAQLAILDNNEALAKKYNAELDAEAKVKTLAESFVAATNAVKYFADYTAYRAGERGDPAKTLSAGTTAGAAAGMSYTGATAVSAPVMMGAVQRGEYTTVNVNVAGSVLTDDDLTNTIQRTILQINKQGRGTTPAGGLSGGT